MVPAKLENVLVIETGQRRERNSAGDLHVLPVMTMTLTCDHRAVDGATGAEFLRTITSFLEDPGLAL